MRESLEKSHLDGELMKQEKYELASALEQVPLTYFSYLIFELKLEMCKV